MIHLEESKCLKYLGSCSKLLWKLLQGYNAQQKTNTYLVSKPKPSRLGLHVECWDYLVELQQHFHFMLSSPWWARMKDTVTSSHRTGIWHCCDVSCQQDRWQVANVMTSNLTRIQEFQTQSQLSSNTVNISKPDHSKIAWLIRGLYQNPQSWYLVILRGSHPQKSMNIRMGGGPSNRKGLGGRKYGKLILHATSRSRFEWHYFLSTHCALSSFSSFFHFSPCFLSHSDFPHFMA